MWILCKERGDVFQQSQFTMKSFLKFIPSTQTDFHVNRAERETKKCEMFLNCFKMAHKYYNFSQEASNKRGNDINHE